MDRTLFEPSHLAIYLVVAGVVGLIIGSFLNVVIWRVPRGESLLPSSKCPGCGAAIRPLQNVPLLSWLALRGRCANCGSRISVRYPLIEAATGVAFVLVAWWYSVAFGGPGEGLLAVSWWIALVAYLWFAAAGIALTAIDLELKRLPDAIVLPSLAVVGVMLLGAAALAGDWPRLVTVLIAGAVMFAFYFLVVLAYPAGMGLGDVKLAPLIGVVTGYVGWASVAVGWFAAFAIGAVVGVAAIAAKASARSAGRKYAIPFGPWMVLGAWTGIVWGDAVAAAYLSISGLA